MEEKTALILAGGRLDIDGGQQDLFRRSFDWVIGVDGGTRHALTLGLTPSLIMGDMDSMDTDDLQSFTHVPTIVFPQDKDKLDSQLAVEWVLDEGATQIVIAGGLGTRFDQSLANAHLLCLIHRTGAHGVVTDGQQTVYLLEGALTLTAPAGTVISVLPVGGPCRGLTLEGLRWPLANYDLYPGDSRTLSNEFAQAPASLTLDHGTALVIVGTID